MEELKQKAHYISVTGIIRDGDRFLICKRSDGEKAFPGKWCVPGGKLEVADFSGEEKDTSDHWLDVFERALKKEVREETGLEVDNIGYVSNLAFLRPNGFSTVIVSLCADLAGGELLLAEDELVDAAWVTLAEAREYDLIENIYEQLEKASRIV